MSPDQLRTIRSDLNLTQREMAQHLSMCYRSYQALENNEARIKNVHKLAAERLALHFAVERKDHFLAPQNMRTEALLFSQLVATPLYKS